MSVSECLLWLLYTYIIPAENMSSWVMEYQFQTSKEYVSRNCLICQQNKTILNKIKVCNKTVLNWILEQQRLLFYFRTDLLERIIFCSHLAPSSNRFVRGWKKCCCPRRVSITVYLHRYFCLQTISKKKRQIEYSTFNTLWNMHKISRNFFSLLKVTVSLTMMHHI